MNGWKRSLALSGVFIFAVCGIAFAQEDEEGCKDHPMFTRMPNFYIHECKEKDFDQVDFKDEKGNDIKVQGKVHFADYRIKEGYKAPSSLQIIRNFQDAIKRIGGVVVYEYLNWYDTYLKLTTGEKTYWVVVDASSDGDGDSYELTIVEKSEMAQEVIADAERLMSDIQATGHASIYGIYFDFDKADIKPESEPAIKEIARLLQENKELKLYVVGHTDNVGAVDYNMNLSRARAEAVTKELVTRYKVSADRLKAYGVGPLAPVASNKAEEGRAKNRRVELVQQ